MIKKKKLSDIPLEIRAEEAMKKAVEKTIEEHRRTGDPIVIWRDGKVVKIPADQIEVREPEVEYKAGDTNARAKVEICSHH